MRYDTGITAVIRSLGGGGAERVLTTMLNYWTEHNIPCSVITTTLVTNHAYPLHPDIRCITVPPHEESNLDDCPWNVLHLRQAIDMERHNIVISFMEKSNLPCILATSGLPVRLIISERIDPRTQIMFSDYKKSLVRKLYPLADALVVQTRNVKENWALNFMPKNKVHVINNMVSLNECDNKKSTETFRLPKRFICCMGRLHESKGFSGLFNVLPQIFAKHPEYSLIVLGEGPERNSLSAQAAALGLNKKILMPGFVNSPHNIIKKADLFILSSLSEGFPNALIEAMRLGIAPISFACPSGPDEIIKNGVNGLLIPPMEYDLLAEAVISTLSNPDKRKKMALNAKNFAEQNYSVSKIMQQWEKLRMQILMQPIVDKKDLSYDNYTL